MTLQQARGGIQQVRGQVAAALGQVQGALQGGISGIGVTEGIPGDRLQRVGPGPPESPVVLGNAMLLDGGKRGERGLRVALGQPQRRGRDAEFPAVAVLLAEPGQELPGPLDLAQAYQGVHQQGPDPGDEVGWPGEPPGHRLAGLQRGQRRGVTVSLQLKRPAGGADRQDGRGLGVGGEGALGAGCRARRAGCSGGGDRRARRPATRPPSP
jgi:hypothetical protein